MQIIQQELSIRLHHPPSREQLRWCFFDCMRFRAIYDGSIDVDYFGTQMYRKSDFVRRESFATGIRFKWRNKVNCKEQFQIFDDKILMYKNFNQFLNRPWKAIENGITKEELSKFCKLCNDVVIAKDPLGGGGRGVDFYNTYEPKEFQELLDRCNKGRVVIEGVIKQCEEIFSLSNSSVNTLRIITIVDNCKRPHVVRAVLRMSTSGAKVDNYSSGGISATVDVQTGIIVSGGINKQGLEYYIHPITGKQIIGYKIIDWEEYKKFALELAMKFPDTHYVGWDIVKNENGFYCMIEGNRNAGADVMESNLLYGLMPIYKEYYEGQVQ